MGLSERQQDLLRRIPGVDHLLERAKAERGLHKVPRTVLVNSARRVVEALRRSILDNGDRFPENRLSDAALLDALADRVDREMAFNLKRVVNATGVVIHTNLGRSLLPRAATDNVAALSGRYSNLEFDLAVGRRGSRYTAVEDILCEVSGAEAGMVVNNNAGAVLLTLETLARGRKVIVSRGELVEIGGSFRIPEVMARSGGILTEVGTTNRTHLRDYEGAVDADTALLLKVHKSNYSVVGFTAEVPLSDLVSLGKQRGLRVMEDLGSGMFIDFAKYGLTREPTVQDSVATGADVVTFSGDKLLGGPQAGLIVGKKDVLDAIKKNPITRALRIDKMTLAALESTLRLYRDPEEAVATIPTLRALAMAYEELKQRAERLAGELAGLGDDRLTTVLLDLPSRVGGGSLPLQALPSCCVGVEIAGLSANAVESAMRSHEPPVIGRIEDDWFIMDPRTVEEDETPLIRDAFRRLLERA